MLERERQHLASLYGLHPWGALSEPQIQWSYPTYHHNQTGEEERLMQHDLERKILAEAYPEEVMSKSSDYDREIETHKMPTKGKANLSYTIKFQFACTGHAFL